MIKTRHEKHAQNTKHDQNKTPEMKAPKSHDLDSGFPEGWNKEGFHVNTGCSESQSMCSAAHVLMIVLAKRRRVPCEQPVSIFALHDVSEIVGVWLVFAYIQLPPNNDQNRLLLLLLLLWIWQRAFQTWESRETVFHGFRLVAVVVLMVVVSCDSAFCCALSCLWCLIVCALAALPLLLLLFFFLLLLPASSSCFSLMLFSFVVSFRWLLWRGRLWAVPASSSIKLIHFVPVVRVPGSKGSRVPGFRGSGVPGFGFECFASVLHQSQKPNKHCYWKYCFVAASPHSTSLKFLDNSLYPYVCLLLDAVHMFGSRRLLGPTPPIRKGWGYHNGTLCSGNPIGSGQELSKFANKQSNCWATCKFWTHCKFEVFQCLEASAWTEDGAQVIAFGMFLCKVVPPCEKWDGGSMHRNTYMSK